MRSGWSSEKRGAQLPDRSACAHAADGTATDIITAEANTTHRIGFRMTIFYSTVKGTETFVVAHAMAIRPPGAEALGSMVNVSCSTVSGRDSLRIATLPKSLRAR